MNYIHVETPPTENVYNNEFKRSNHKKLNRQDLHYAHTHTHIHPCMHKRTHVCRENNNTYLGTYLYSVGAPHRNLLKLLVTDQGDLFYTMGSHKKLH